MGTRNFIAIGGSVGSVAAVKQLLSQLPVGFAPSVFIALHVGARGATFWRISLLKTRRSRSQQLWIVRPLKRDMSMSLQPIVT